MEKSGQIEWVKCQRRKCTERTSHAQGGDLRADCTDQGKV